MDDRNNKSDNDQTNGSSGSTKVNGSNKTRPSGSSGSKISSRQSENSIAKLVETLEATAGVNLGSGWSKGNCLANKKSLFSLNNVIYSNQIPINYQLVLQLRKLLRT